MRRSSTSSSERLPWAGVWAAIVVIAVDLLLFSSLGPWKFLERRVPEEQLLANGIARDRLQLNALAAVPEGTARVVVVGSSRARAGFLPGVAEQAGRGPVPFRVELVAHAGIDVFAIRSLADELAGYRPDVVVLLLSEFDTHRPPEPRAAASFGSFSAVVDLASAVGVGFSFEARAHLYRLALASVLDAYRYRSVVEAAGASKLRSFPMGGRRAGRWRDVPLSDFGYPAGEPSPLDVRRSRQLENEVDRRFSEKNAFAVRWQSGRVRSLTRGDHAAVQMTLVREAVGRLRAAGADVILVEAPLSPMAAEYYDATIREDFVAFARDLARDPGVHFVPLKVRATYPEEELIDLVHLNPAGAQKLTAAILQALQEVLEERS